VIERILRWYLRWIGGGDWPFLLVEREYLGARVAPGADVADLGGGDGRLANVLAPRARRVFIVDSESTSLPGADSRLYAGSLAHAMRTRQSGNIYALRGDATTLPFTGESLDMIVSSQLLEHIADGGKERFFRECARVLKPNGLLAVSTPNGDYIETHTFWVPAVARKAIPTSWIARLPRLMRGPWLELGVEAWESNVGHYDHGCRLKQLRAWSRTEGFEELDLRFLHTRLTSFWFQLLCTFPLFFLVALPLVRALYLIETTVTSRDGVNLMMTFRKAS
jgi:SAM-dependent methyltransferase